jgi:FecR protein
MAIRLGKLLGFWAVLAVFLTVSASAESKARIVRLSDVQGSTQMDRGNGDGFEKAYLNMPIIEGAKLKTGSNGKAEIEFEDGSVMHVVPDSQLVFTHLALGDDGQKLTTVELTEGTVYGNVHSKKGDRFTLNFVRESLTVPEPAHFRVELSNAEATVAVFQGNVEVAGPSGQVEIGKKHSATFDLANNDSYALAKNYEEDPYDDWDKQQNDTHDRYANGGRDIQSPYAYGMSDLNYYGGYMNIPGYGMGWQPYFIDASWSPYQDGGWAYYPGYGYMWVSSYPWGWMPYRYGSWNFIPGYGWVWMPGNNWNTWYPVTPVVNPPKRTPVVTPPVRGRTTVMIGKGLSVNPPVGTPRRIVIAPGSAGLGVPRGSVRNLDRIAHESIKTEQPVQVPTVQPPVHFEPRESPSYRGGGSSGSHSSAPSAPPVVSSPAPARSTTVKH